MGAAKVEDVAKKLDCPDGAKNIVINNVNGNTIVVNDHVKVDHDGPKPPPPHPPTSPPKPHPPMKALTNNNNPVECGVCEYVGLALLLRQTPEVACRDAFASQPATKVDACLAFAAPFEGAMKEFGAENHKHVMKLCQDHKHC